MLGLWLSLILERVKRLELIIEGDSVFEMGIGMELWLNLELRLTLTGKF